MGRLILKRFGDIKAFQRILRNAFYRAPRRFLRIRTDSRLYEFGKGRRPIVFTAPHASKSLPAEYKKLYPGDYDPMTGEMAKSLAKKLDGYYLVARYSRTLVDLNRSPNDFRRRGVVPHIHYDTREIILLNETASKKEKRERVRRYWKPFHAKLARLLNYLVDRHLFAYVFDIHFLNAIAPPGTPDEGTRRAEICMGICDFEIADKVLALYVKDMLERKGYEAVIDKPFRGGFVVRNASAIPQVNAIEFEINEKIMLNEKKRKTLMEDLVEIIDELVKGYVVE